MCLHPSVSLDNAKNCREINEDKIEVCEKSAGVRSGNSSDLDSTCLKVLVTLKIFWFSDMHNTFEVTSYGLSLLSELQSLNSFGPNAAPGSLLPGSAVRCFATAFG